MYRLLFFVLLCAILIPIVWRIVNRVFFKVSKALSKDEDKADDVIESFLHQQSQIEERQKWLEEESIRAKEEADKLSVFQAVAKKQRRSKKNG